MKFGTEIPQQNLLGKLDFGAYRQNITTILYEAQFNIYKFFRKADRAKINIVMYFSVKKRSPSKKLRL